MEELGKHDFNTWNIQGDKESKIDISSYDFLDFGASKGGSIDFAVRRLGGVKGLGVDNDPRKIALLREAGLDCIEADVRDLQLPDDSVRFVVMSHFLEHLPDMQVAEKAIDSAARVASDFLFIQGPCFDDDQFLARRGLKYYWSDWRGHRLHLTTLLLGSTLMELGLKDYVMMGCRQVKDSADSSLHPLESKRDQHDYDTDLHPRKPFIKFRRPLYKEIVCCVKLRPFGGWNEVLGARKGCEEIGVEKVERASAKVGRRSSELSSEAISLASEDSISTTSNRDAKRKQKHFNEIVKRLMTVRRWSYLRYLHLREGLLRTQNVKTFLAVGCGRGYAEIALALEFPEIEFHLTDIKSERTPNYQNAQELAEAWDLKNVTFGIRDIFDSVPDGERYDMVASVEVLGHIQDDETAARKMHEAASKYVFALVPFADEETNSNEKLRARVFERNEHYRVGYDRQRLQSLFPGATTTMGCYWKDLGGLHRRELQDMSDQEIESNLAELHVKARGDVIEEVPEIYPEAQGIWVLAEVR